MGERLAGGNLAIALLANTGATVGMLAVLIATLAPVSGAHFNPVVTLVAFWLRQLSVSRAGAYIVAQIAGCCTGALLANVMFDLPAIQFSTQARTGIAQWISEIVATAGLIFIAFTSPARAVAWRVSAWIGAAYWFTASTSFANPAITLGRSLTDTFAGISRMDAPGFILAELAGGLLGAGLVQLFVIRKSPA